jgi:hypothetical protein
MSMTQEYYRFIGRHHKVGGDYKIPHGAIVKLIYWGAKRRVLVEYNGETIMTRGNLLRKNLT